MSEKLSGGDNPLASREVAVLRGRAFRFGDGISTDHIAPGRLYHLRSDLSELAKHVLEDADPTFATRLRAGDFVVAGSNFGLGSSREHAPAIMKIAGIGAVVAKSVARIFFRNAINVGLPVLVCDTDFIGEGDDLEIDLAAGTVRDISNGQTAISGRMPAEMVAILREGGLAAYVRSHGDLDF